MSLARLHSPTVNAMRKTVQLSESVQDSILMRLIGVAWVKVLRLVRACYRDDMVQDLIAEWLAALRAGTWNYPPEGLDEYVESAVRQRLTGNLRHRQRSLHRDHVHAEIIAGAPREWMSQDLKIESDRLDAFAEAVRATLPRKYVRAHRMVRDDGLTYAEAARRLRTSVASIHKYVTVVQRTFRAALRGSGVEPMPSVRGGRPAQATARPVTGNSRRAGVRARRSDGIDLRARVVADLRPEPTATRVLSPVASIVPPALIKQSTVTAIESTGMRMESTGLRMESTVQPKRSTGIANELPATATVSPAGSKESPAGPNESPAQANVSLAEANDSTAMGVVPSARRKWEPVATKLELEGREGTPETTNVRLVVRIAAPAPTIESLGRQKQAPVEAIVSPAPRDESTETANVRPVAHEYATEAAFDTTAPINETGAPVNESTAPAQCETAPTVGSTATPSVRHATASLQHATDPAAHEHRPEDPARGSVHSRTVTRTHATRSARHARG
jgi:DNA-directed RNA polymerase specialized sigma24 family protein